MPDRGSDHLTPHEIAAYLAGSVTGTDRDQMERHLTICDPCRLEMVAGSRDVPRPNPAKWVAVAVPLAAAAVMATLLLLPSGPRPDPATPVSPVLRGESSEGVPTFDALEPADGETVGAAGIQFGWRSKGSDAHYSLTLADAQGDVVWTRTSPDTVLALPDEILLEAGSTYFWFVDALLPGARFATTGIQKFMVEG